MKVAVKNSDFCPWRLGQETSGPIAPPVQLCTRERSEVRLRRTRKVQPLLKERPPIGVGEPEALGKAQGATLLVDLC
jgi:hypothetical protein